MATYQISIDEKNLAGQRFAEYMKTLPFVSIIGTKKMNALDEALLDIEEGRTFEIEDWEKYTQQLIEGKNDQI